MLNICHRCDQRRWAEKGLLVCAQDGRNVVEHSESGVCPLGKFEGATPTPLAVPLAGDLVAAVTAKFGIGRVAKFAAKLVGRPDCGCAKRQQWLNRLDARVRRLTRQ